MTPDGNAITADADTLEAATEASSLSSPERPASVSVDHLTKSFRRAHVQYATLKERVLNPRALGRARVLQALQDVTFDVAPGEFFGIVGRNGSGKSTLLKCVAGIYSVETGEVRVSGRLSPFIELGVGFNPELTARDNVIINGIMLGLSGREARARFDEIVAFAELEEFLDLKLKNYSSGMLVRLAFSVAIQVDADVLLIDEVLAVGDAAFQKKSFETFSRLHREGRTVLFVTHDMGAVQRFCDRALLLERGRLIAIGDPSTVTRRYNEVNFTQLSVPSDTEELEPEGSAVSILDVWFEDGTGTRIGSCAPEQPLVACMHVAFLQPMEKPQFSMVLRNEVHQPIVVATSQRTHGDLGQFRDGQTVVVKVKFDNWLASDRYYLSAIVSRMGADWEVIDHRSNAATLLVEGAYVSGALLEPPYELDIDLQ